MSTIASGGSPEQKSLNLTLQLDFMTKCTKSLKESEVSKGRVCVDAIDVIHFLVQLILLGARRVEIVLNFDRFKNPELSSNYLNVHNFTEILF